MGFIVCFDEAYHNAYDTYCLDADHVAGRTQPEAIAHVEKTWGDEAAAAKDTYPQCSEGYTDGYTKALEQARLDCPWHEKV